MANNRRTRGPLAVLLGFLVPSAALANDGFYFGGHVGYLFGTGTATLGDPVGAAASGGSERDRPAVRRCADGLADHPAARAGWSESSSTSPSWMPATMRRSCPTAPPRPAMPTSSSNISARRAAGWATPSASVDAVRHRRPRLRQHPLGSHRPYDRQRGCNAGPVATWLDPRGRRRLRARSPLVGPAGVSLHAAAAHRLLLRVAGALRLAVRHPSLPGRARTITSAHPTRRRRTETADDRGPGTWELHGQTTFIFQGYPPFNSPYQGTNSLPGVGQSRETWTVSAFLGMRLWQGGELYYNPELLQGFGLANTVGAAGFPNGEAQKSNFPFPRYNTSRLFLRQEIGLGGKTDIKSRASTASSRAQGRLAAHLPGRQVRRARRVRRQRLCRGFARRLPQLVDLGGRRLRLSGRPGRPDLWHHRRAEPGALGGAARLLSGRQRAQRQCLRHEFVQPRRLCRRARDALRAVRQEGRRQARHLAHQHLRRLLQRRHGACARHGPSPAATPSRRRARAAPSMASISTCSRTSPTRSACSAASAGTTGAARSAPSPTSTKPVARPAAQGRLVGPSRRPHRPGRRLEHDLARPQPLSRPAASACWSATAG